MSAIPSSSTFQQDRQFPVPGKALEHQIALADHTKAAKSSVQATEEELSDQDTDPATPGGSSSALARRWTSQSLNVKTQLQRRKYNRYRNHLGPHDPGLGPADGASDAKKGKLHRGKKKVKGLIKRKPTRLTVEDDAVIDILYENQRGSFFFGIPLFSSRALGGLDPKPWLNGNRKQSPVDIRNAQVPDPNWEWAWPSWYVDMSRDVDEEGWEYSFSFQNGFAWHGNHPWFHSFVRRRRWLRKRVRKHAHHAEGKSVSGRHMAEAHQFTSEYFTIHSERNMSVGSSGSVTPSSSSRPKVHAREDDPAEKDDLRDMGTLLRFLRKAAVDREKLVLVRTFVENASAELHYLAEEMPTIMSLFVFQDSRRQLLGMLSQKFDEVTKHREEHKEKNKEEGTEEKRRIDNLLRAMNVADGQVKRLEYWSDIRDMTRKGEDGATDASRGWKDQQWQGLDTSGPGNDTETTAKEPGKSEAELEQDARVVEKELDAEAGAEADSNSDGGQTPRPLGTPKALGSKDAPRWGDEVQGSSEETGQTFATADPYEGSGGSPDTIKAKDESFPFETVDEDLTPKESQRSSDEFVTPDEVPHSDVDWAQ